MKWLLTFSLVVLAAHPNVASATTAACQPSSKYAEVNILEGIAASGAAFYGEVTAVESNVQTLPQFPDNRIVAGTQKITLRVLNSWKGPYQVGGTVHIAVSVTSICGGVGCVSPFKVGDTTVLLSPFPPSELPEGFGCWTRYEGVEIQRVLWVPMLSSD